MEASVSCLFLECSVVTAGRGSHTMQVLTAGYHVATGDEHTIRVRLEMTMWSMECYMRLL